MVIVVIIVFVMLAVVAGVFPVAAAIDAVSTVATTAVGWVRRIAGFGRIAGIRIRRRFWRAREEREKSEHPYSRQHVASQHFSWSLH